MSLDGYIAGPKGEADWIIMPKGDEHADFDFRAFYEQFDTALIGRQTWEFMLGGKKTGGPMPGMKTFVFSRTLRQSDHPKVTIVGENAEETVAELRAQPGKDIWLFGGGLLFRSLADAGLVDTVEVAVVPVLLSEGVPLLPPGGRVKLELTGHKVYRTGIVSLEYAVKQTAATARGKRSATVRRRSRPEAAAGGCRAGGSAAESTAADSRGWWSASPRNPPRRTRCRR
jgi:dihydrofolate reductase